MKKLFYIIIPIFLLSACSTQRIVVSADKNANYAPDYKKDDVFFVSGVAQTQTVDATQICGSKDNVAAYEVKQTFLNGFLGQITYGIYTPRQAQVFCTK